MVLVLVSLFFTWSRFLRTGYQLEKKRFDLYSFIVVIDNFERAISHLKRKLPYYRKLFKIRIRRYTFI